MAALLTVLLGTTLKGQTQSNASVSTVIMPVNTVNQKGIYFISMTSFFKKKKIAGSKKYITECNCKCR